MSGLAQVTSPPYDVVGAAAAVRLRDSDPHNVIRLTLPAEDDAAVRRGASYRAAGHRLRQWIAEGVLVPDAAAGLYVYEECGDGPGAHLQRGLIGAVQLAPPSAGIVLPHEDVTAAVVADRRRLMEATDANLEPIFLLYEGGGAATQLVDEVGQTRAPIAEAVTEGVRHRLWAVTDPAELAAVSADLADRHAIIADGHHRYCAYLELQGRRHGQGRDGGPWDYGLALLVDSVAYPPHIAPIHRVLPGLPPRNAVERARSVFTVRALPPGTGLATALRELRSAGRGAGPGAGGTAAGGTPTSPRDGWSRVAFLLAGGDGFHLLTDPDPAKVGAAMPAGHSERWRWLDTSVLHEVLIRVIWEVGDERHAVRLVHDDAAAAVHAARPGGTAVICNPPQVTEVLRVAAGGELMPRKSTSFGPKPRTGLVLRAFAYG